MAGDKRHVDVAAFPDGLAVVKRLKHGEQARMFLNQPRDGIQNAGPRLGIPAPGLLRLAGGCDGGINILGGGLADPGQGRAVRGVLRIEAFSRFRVGSGDEMAEAALVALQPSEGLGCILGRRAVIHRFEDFLNGHGPGLHLD